MKKTEKSSELLWLFGIVFVALGVALCSKADLGVSMIAAIPFVVHEYFAGYFPFLTVGVTEYIVQGIMLIILAAAVKRFNLRYVLSFAVAVIYGYTLDFFIRLITPITLETVLMRWIVFLIGDILCALGVACFFKTYLPLEVYELFVSEIADKFKINITKVKWSFDISLFMISAILALILFRDVNLFDWSSLYYKSYHSIGLATIVTTIINSPIIAFFSRIIDKMFVNTPAFPKIKKIIKNN